MVKRRNVVIGLLFLLVVLAVGGVAFAAVTFNRPAQGTVEPVAQQRVAVNNTYDQPARYVGNYVSFTYPAHYRRASSQASKSLEVVDYFSTDAEDKHIAIDVERGSLANNSGLTFRQQHPDLYHQDPDTRYGLIFYKSDADGSERTAFLAHNGLEMSIAISTSRQVDLTSDLRIILTSLAWRQ